MGISIPDSSKSKHNYTILNLPDYVISVDSAPLYDAYAAGVNDEEYYYSYGEVSDYVYKTYHKSCTNSTKNFSILKQIWGNFPNWPQSIAILIVLFIALWTMKWLMKLFYKIGNLISPFSLVKVTGLITMLIGVWFLATHLFQVSTMFKISSGIIDDILPFWKFFK
jgi:hypothetical protein